MAGYELYGGLPPHVHVDTSLLAAISILPRVAAKREQVRHYVELCGTHGATSDEVEAATGICHQTASARARELEQLGELVKTPDMRMTRRHHRARVYVVARLARPLVPPPARQPERRRKPQPAEVWAQSELPLV